MQYINANHCLHLISMKFTNIASCYLKCQVWFCGKYCVQDAKASCVSCTSLPVLGRIAAYGMGRIAGNGWRGCRVTMSTSHLRKPLMGPVLEADREGARLHQWLHPALGSQRHGRRKPSTLPLDSLKPAGKTGWLELGHSWWGFTDKWSPIVFWESCHLGGK